MASEDTPKSRESVPTAFGCSDGWTARTVSKVVVVSRAIDVQLKVRECEGDIFERGDFFGDGCFPRVELSSNDVMVSCEGMAEIDESVDDGVRQCGEEEADDGSQSWGELRCSYCEVCSSLLFCGGGVPLGLPSWKLPGVG